MKKNQEKIQPENIAEAHLHAPVELDLDLTLNEDDIESRVSPKDVPVWKTKKGGHTYHLSPVSRMLIIYSEESGPRLFKLKEDSQLLQKYVEKHNQKK